MITIRELLDRIRWDREFGAAEFTLGYHDRVAGQVLVVSLASVWFEPENHFFFHLEDADGRHRSIPLHRVVEVYRNGERIWHREHA